VWVCVCLCVVYIKYVSWYKTLQHYCWCCILCVCVCVCVYVCVCVCSSGILLFQQQVNDSHHGRRQSTTKNSGHCCKTSLKQLSMTGSRRQLTSKNSGDSCKTSSKQPSMGIMSRENSRGGFPFPSSRLLPSSVLLLDSYIIDTSMQGSCQRQSCCHRAVMVVQECCCAFEL